MFKDKSLNEKNIFCVTTLVLSLSTWPISFTLGAYGDVFYTNVMTVWVASLAALLSSIIVGRNAESDINFTWWGAFILLLPSVLMLSVVLGLVQYPLIISILEWLLLIVAVPYIAYILMMTVVPNSIELRSKKLWIGLVSVLILVNLASFSVGKYNYYFFTCDDFTKAGDSLPKNCWKDGKDR